MKYRLSVNCSINPSGKCLSLDPVFRWDHPKGHSSWDGEEPLRFFVQSTGLLCLPNNYSPSMLHVGKCTIAWIRWFEHGKNGKVATFWPKFIHTQRLVWITRNLLFLYILCMGRVKLYMIYIYIIRVCIYIYILYTTAYSDGNHIEHICCWSTPRRSWILSSTT